MPKLGEAVKTFASENLTINKIVEVVQSGKVRKVIMFSKVIVSAASDGHFSQESWIGLVKNCSVPIKTCLKTLLSREHLTFPDLENMTIPDYLSITMQQQMIRAHHEIDIIEKRVEEESPISNVLTSAYKSMR